jgi:hypothetical protein
MLSGDGVGGVGTEVFKLRAKQTRREKFMIHNSLRAMHEISARRIRIQNLRFAHSLCGAQRMSSAIKI